MNVDLKFIRVESGGSFIMGSADCPLSSKIILTFYGDRVNKSVNDIGFDPLDNGPLGSKGIAFLSGSNVQIYGQLYQRSWTELVKTAPKGTNRLELAEAVKWKAGDSIVITSTDFGEVYDSKLVTKTSPLSWARGVAFPSQNEERTILGLDGNMTLILNAPLNFTHFASADGKMRSEVGLLTRRIVFRGDDSSDSSFFGGHLIVRKVDSFKMQGVEITKFGQKGLMGRYSFHFHLLQNKPLGLNFEVNDNSVHRSYQRCYVVHDTNHVMVRNNVCFRSHGHMYFLEDGSEVGNSFINNLGVDPIPIDYLIDPYYLLVSDADVSVFWITNPNNTFLGNHAVGGRFSFWFSMPTTPTGLSTGKYPGYNPRTAPLGLFENNVAHSTSGNALHIDHMVIATSPTGETDVASYVVTEAIFSGFTAYKSRNYGVWVRGGFHRFENAYLSDNRISMDLTGGPSILYDSTIIGESDNAGDTYRSAVDKLGRSRPEYFEQTNGILNILKGYENYDTNGPQFLRNVEFFNFTTNSLRYAGALSILNGNFKLPTRNRFAKLKFDNSNRYFTFPMNHSIPYENHKGVALMDTDSSVINIGSLGGWITANVSTMTFFPQCKFNSDWNAYQCPFFGESYAQLKVFNKNLLDLNTTGSDGVNRPDLKNDAIKIPRMIVVDLLRNLQAESIGTTLVGTTDFQMLSNVIARGFYRLSWPYNIPSPEDLSFALDSCATNDWIVVAVQYPRGTKFTAKFVKGASSNFLSKASNLTDVLNEPSKYYYYDDSSEHLYLKLQNFAPRTAYRVVDQFVDYLSAGVYYVNVTCPNNICAPSQFSLPYSPKTTYKTLMREDRFVGRLRTCTQTRTRPNAANSTPGKGLVFAFLDVKTASLDFTVPHDLNAIITSLDIGIGLEGTEEYIANPTSKIIPYSQSRFGFRLSNDEWNYLLQGKMFVRLSTTENPNGYMRTQLYINNATATTCNLPPAISTFQPCGVLNLKNSAHVINIYDELATFNAGWTASAFSPVDVRNSYVNTNSAPAICGTSSLSFGFRTGSATIVKKAGTAALNLDTNIYKYFEFFIKTINSSGGSPGLGIIFSSSVAEISRITPQSVHIQHFKIDGNRVTRVRIPISELGFAATQNVHKIVFYLSDFNEKYMEYMLDNMRFIGELSAPDATERTMTVSQCKYFGTVTSACGPTDNPDSDPLRIRYL